MEKKRGENAVTILSENFIENLMETYQKKIDLFMI